MTKRIICIKIKAWLHIYHDAVGEALFVVLFDVIENQLPKACNHKMQFVVAILVHKHTMITLHLQHRPLLLKCVSDLLVLHAWCSI